MHGDSQPMGGPLEAAVSTFASKRVGVYGDHCLDRYMVGRMEAISRDAPVPIVRLHEDRYTPGGGGNVAMNARALGAEVYALGAIGNDVSGETLCGCYRDAGIHETLLVKCAGRRVIAFNKLYAAAEHGWTQQVARFDQENHAPLSPEAERQVMQRMSEVVPGLDAVLICDYEEVPDTGGVTRDALAHLRALAQDHDVLLAADSRMRIGALGALDIAVPNDLEAAIAAGLVAPGFRGDVTDPMVQDAGTRLSARTGIRWLAITRGAKGMTVFQRDAEPVHVPTRPPVGDIDVTGAGDTVLAAVALASSAGLPIEQACGLANLAAWVTIHKLNTTGTCSPEELLRAFCASGPHPAGPVATG